MKVMQKESNRTRGRRGNSLVEVTLMAPWIFFLFIGVLDFGFYSYAFISTENAARAAALYTSRSKAAASDTTGACTIVLAELQYAAYGRTLPATCNAAPLLVQATLVTGADGADATRVAVTYTTISMIPIPGVLAASFPVTRTWQMKVDPSADF
jgi:Flp pilus assembly protein TadG